VVQLFMALIVMILLGLALWWTFGSQRPAGPPAAGRALPSRSPLRQVRTGVRTRPAAAAGASPHEDYGLLRRVAIVSTSQAATALRDRLRRTGMRATTSTVDGGGYCVLVFAHDVPAARTVLRDRRHP
jgi:hypothetical protein